VHVTGIENMNVTLRNEDALAIDLLLNRSSAASMADGSGGFVQAVDGVGPERVRAAEKVLGLLRMMPADEPASDLLTKTMNRIEDRFQPAAVDRPVLDPMIHSPHPHA
jgi:hypothetical protein